MKKKTIWEMGRLSAEEFRKSRKIPLIIVLDNIRSLNNIGSIFRSSDGFAVQRLVLCGITSCPPSVEIHKTALGAEDTVEWVYEKDTLEAVCKLREKGVKIVSLELTHGSVSLADFTPEADTVYALVVGNEVDGVNQEVVDFSDFCLEIPQSGTKHSLNVSVSAAVAAWTFYSYYLHQ